MKSSKKKEKQTKTIRTGKSKDAEMPLELDRGWQELEAQHDRIKTDWSSLAAQLGIGSKSGPEE